MLTDKNKIVSFMNLIYYPIPKLKQITINFPFVEYTIRLLVYGQL